jgi:type III secretion protein L
MIIWLRQPNTERTTAGANTGVGVASDIVPRESLAALTQLDAGYLALQRQHAEVLSQAARDADAMLAAARADADALRADARREYDTAQQRGYDAGCRDALSQWYARTAQLLDERYELQMSLRQRVADLVVSAVEKIVINEQPAALFARASDVVERIIEGSRTLQIRVHPDERDAAVEEFSRAAAQWRERGQLVQLTIQADRTLEPGACVCDTDIGSVDASLKVQIEAVRMAVDAALRRVANEAGVPSALAQAAFAEVTTHRPLALSLTQHEGAQGAQGAQTPPGEAQPADVSSETAEELA